MSCRHCKLLVVKPDSDGKTRVRAGYAYRCGYVFPSVETLNLPASVRDSSYVGGFVWPPMQSYVTPDDGDGCVQFVDKRGGRAG